MTKITGMALRNIEVNEDGEDETVRRSFTVYAEDLEYHFGPAYHQNSTRHEFFMLACEYVEIYNGEVVSTDEAKIDEVFVAS